jgi:hypothetical protein
MDVAYLSAMAALVGSVVGGLTAGGTAWLSQRAPAERTSSTQADTRLPSRCTVVIPSLSVSPMRSNGPSPGVLGYTDDASGAPTVHCI